VVNIYIGRTGMTHQAQTGRWAVQLNGDLVLDSVPAK
jgi:hypothetical protein